MHGKTLLLSILWVSLFANAQNLPFQAFTSEDGLPQSVVIDIAQDHQGFLWFATRAGLSRFDGKHFVNHTQDDGLPDDLIYTLFEDDDWRLWFGAGSAAASLKNGAVSNLPAAASLWPAAVRDILADKTGALWFATSKGVARYDGQQFKVYEMADGLIDNSVDEGVLLDTGDLWFGTESGVAIWSQGGWSSLDLDPIQGADVRALARDADGRVWIGAVGMGVYIWDGESLTHVSQIPKDTVPALYLDRENRMWAATRENGAYCFAEDGSVSRYNRSNGLGSDSVYAIYQDHEGSMWFGTFGNGAVRLGTEDFHLVMKGSEYLFPNVQTLEEDDLGNIWIGTEGNGVTRMHEDGDQTFRVKDGLVHQSIFDIHLGPNGGLWFGSLEGVGLFKNGQWRRFGLEDGLPNVLTPTITHDQNGVMWFGTHGGLVSYDGVTFKIYDVSDGLVNNKINRLLFDTQGRLWIGTRTGVSRFEDGVFTTIDVGMQEYIYDMVQGPEGSLWFASRIGLIRYDEGSGARHHTRRDGLPHNNIRALTFDDRGWLWIGTTRGISYYDGQRFRTFDRNDGISSNEINLGAGYKDRSGNIWFGSIFGATVFKKDAAFVANRVPPPVHISKFEVLNRPHAMEDPVRLGPKETSIRFEYVGISFASPDALTYQYKLEGFDEVWGEQKLRSIQYTSLPPGDYSFKVKARNKDGVWSESPAVLDFSIAVPYWQQAWFLLLIFIALGGAGLSYHQSRIRKERLRAEIITAQEASRAKSSFLAHISHELRTPLNAIIGYGELLEEDFEDDGAASYLADIRKILMAGRQLTGLINNLLDLTKIESGRMEVFLEEVSIDEVVETVRYTVMPILEKNENVLDVRCSKDLDTIYADKAKLKQILLNLVGNAGKFTEKGRILLDISKDPGGRWFVFKVVDSGIGIQHERVTELFKAFSQVSPGSTSKYGGAGLGLTIIKKFCDLMGGEISVESEINQGSTFVVKLPVITNEPDKASIPIQA